MTIKNKLETYENFLYKLASSDKESIAELVRNADRWAYGQKQPKEEQETKRFVEWTLQTLCNTPATDSKNRKALREKLKRKKKK